MNNLVLNVKTYTNLIKAISSDTWRQALAITSADDMGQDLQSLLLPDIFYLEALKA